MKRAWNKFVSEAGRFKLVLSLLGIFLSGAFIATGGTAWYYSTVIHDNQLSHASEIWRLQKDLHQERVTNRKEIRRLARLLDRNTDFLGNLTKILADTAKTAKQAASTASGASREAKKASKDAAKTVDKVQDTVDKVQDATQDLNKALAPSKPTPKKAPDWLGGG